MGCGMKSRNIISFRMWFVAENLNEPRGNSNQERKHNTREVARQTNSVKLNTMFCKDKYYCSLMMMEGRQKIYIWDIHTPWRNERMMFYSVPKLATRSPRSTVWTHWSKQANHAFAIDSSYAEVNSEHVLPSFPDKTLQWILWKIVSIDRWNLFPSRKFFDILTSGQAAVEPLVKGKFSIIT